MDVVMMVDRKVAYLVSVVVLLAFSAGCNIYRSIDEPPEQTESDAATDTTSDADEPDTTSDTGDDAEDGGDCVAVGDPDEESFYCGRANAECGNISVVDDCGTEHNVNCGSCPDGASCTGGPTNFPRTCSCDCEIGGTCYADGNANPNNPCQVCDSSNPNDWSDAPADTTCDDGDSLSCTGVCSSGTCTSSVRSSSCAIAGACYSEGDPNPSNPCEVCDPATSTDSWTANSGNTCADGDNLDCTGICVSGTCESEPRDGSCVIDGTCWSAGTENPSNECQVCIDSESQTDWSLTNASRCGGTNSCECNASFECVKIGNRNPCN